MLYNPLTTVVLVLLALFPIVTGTKVSYGQVLTDLTLPTPTKVDPIDGELRITQGTQRGDNLFHSFHDFSLTSGMLVHFDNPSTVQNIITRVTGGQVSNIDGTIKANGTANLFFLNPQGIIFGKNASLDIGGSFIATTASSIRFADGTELSTTAGTTKPILSISAPVGLQFGSQANSIVNSSTALPLTLLGLPSGLSVQPNRTLALVGGDVRIESGGVNAFAGRVEIVSVGENSLVGLQPHPQGWTVEYENVSNLRDVKLSGTAFISANGSNGHIDIKGRNIILSDEAFVANYVIDDNSTASISLRASESVQLIGKAEILPPTITNSVQSGATGNGGNLIISTRKLYLEHGAILDTSTFGDGRGGNLIINASESVDIAGTSPSISASTISSSTISTQGEEKIGRGEGGSIIITTKRLSIRDGGFITTVTANREGNGGKIAINASESVHIKGQGLVEDRMISSQINSTSGFEPRDFDGIGRAGDIEINTPQLRVEDKALVTAGTFRSVGAAGSIMIQAKSIILDNQAQLSTASDSGAGGNIFINAADSLALRHHSQISAQAGTSGDGGNININARYILAVPNQNSDIQANAPQGNGGTITINAQNLLGIQSRLEATPLSDITASGGANFQSGEITINRPEVDPKSGLVSQDTRIANTDTLITPACSSGGRLASGEFIITGRGGLPTDPFDTANIPQGIPDLEGIPRVQSNVLRGNNPSVSRKIEPPAIVEAQGWTVNQAGEIVLLAAAEPNPLLLPSPCLR